MNDARRSTLLSTGLLAVGFLGTPLLMAQAPSGTAPAGGTQAAGAARLLGTVTATSDESLTLKLETGGEAMVAILPQTRIVRTAPGEKTLAGATTIHVSDLTAGDRVMVRGTAGADATHYNATVVIAMKQADIAQAHASQAEDWQKRGVSGVVKSIQPADPGAPAAATIVLGTAQPGHTLTVHVTPATILRRYAADSVNFADAKPGALDAIHAGDQLRARGDKSEDGSEVSAVEVVSGSFRNVAGTILSIDLAQSTVTVTDLATKKPVALHLTAETQMRKLPPQMAQMLAQRLGSKAGGAAAPGAGHAPAAAAGGPASGPAEATPGEARGHGDPATMLQRAPLVTLAELKKGDAVMVVATEGGIGAMNTATAITLIAGVEPLLQGSSGASQSLFSASWNLGGGGAEAVQ